MMESYSNQDLAKKIIENYDEKQKLELLDNIRSGDYHLIALELRYLDILELEEIVLKIKRGEEVEKPQKELKIEKAEIKEIPSLVSEKPSYKKIDQQNELKTRENSNITDQNLKSLTKKNKIEKNRSIILKIITYLLLFIWAFTVLFPFFFMVITSLKGYGTYASEYIPKLYVTDPTLANYKAAFTEINLPKFMLNTVVFALSTTLLMVVVSVLAAYGFARIKFKGRDFVFTIFLTLMMIPAELVIITNYTTIVNLGWRNTLVGLVLPSITSVFYIYLLRDNFMQVPDTLYYAAKVDGCNDFNYLLKVMIPINRPTIVSITILKLIECWNSYIWPRLVTTEEGKFLVSNGIQIIRESGFGRDNVPGMMGAVVIVSTPLIILFLCFRKQIMTGVSKSGTKG